MRPTLTHLFRHLHRDDRGLTTVEYVIVLCLIAAVSVGTWQKFGSLVYKKLDGARDDIQTALDKKP